METTGNGGRQSQRRSVVTICYNPLKPPRLSVSVGHVLCSCCHDKLVDRSRCHVCNMDSGYKRCIAVDHILHAITVPCPNAAHGCAARTAYHDIDVHAGRCPHAPSFCPETGCGFAGATASLLAHFTGSHGWPFTNMRRGRALDVQLQEGKRILLPGDVDGGHYLFLVNVAAVGAAGLVGTVLLVESPGAATRAARRFLCKVSFHCQAAVLRQSSAEFVVRRTSLSGGLPVNCHAFFEPKVGRPPAAAVAIVANIQIITTIPITKKRLLNHDPQIK